MGRYKDRVNQRLRMDNKVRKLTDKELETVHQIYLQMMDDIMEFCNTNHISITLSGGSVLGAVRHHGFIPWDDDLDLNITRNDFDRLKEVLSTCALKRYNLTAPNHTQGNQLRMAQIVNPNVIIEDYLGRRHGLAVDLFIIENVPNKHFISYIHGLRSMFYTAVAGFVIDYEFEREDRKIHPGQKAMALERRIRLILGKMLSFRSAEKWVNKLDKVNQYKDNMSRYVSIPTGRGHYFGEIYSREGMTISQMVPFEDRKYPIPTGYDEYLGKLYGDYMTPPPEEKREYHYIRTISFR